MSIIDRLAHLWGLAKSISARSCLYAALGAATAFSSASHGIQREDIGVLKIHDILLRPNFFLGEGGRGSFSIGESSFALRWELEEKFAGVIRLGPRSLINPSARYSATVEDDVLLVEAFAELNHPYGRFRFGRIPVEFGLEGKMWERHLIFPRSLLFKERVVMLRDVGGSYEIVHNNFYTAVAAHNGEGDSDQDGRLWTTSRWGYYTDRFEIGVTGMTGGTKPAVTSLSGDTLAGVDPTNEAHWRMGGIYSAVHNKGFDWTLEYYIGEREQDDVIGKFVAGHTDMSFEIDRYLSVHLRYDHFDPNLKIANDLQQEVSLGIMLSNKTHSSNLLLVGTKVLEEAGIAQVPNDELRLIWTLSPSGIVRF